MSNHQQHENSTLTEDFDKEVNHLFPVFLKLENLRVLLVGAGKVGLEKLQAVLNNAPATNISIVSQEVSAEVRNFVQSYSSVTIEERPFAENDVDGKDIVIVAVNDKDVSNYVRQVAKEKKVLINVADTPDQCDFYLSSIVQKGQLKIAISTNGKSPTGAKRIKEVLQQAMPDELDDVIANLHEIRNKLDGDFQYKVKKLNELTRGLVTDAKKEKDVNWRRIATYSLIAFALMLVGHFLLSYVPLREMTNTTVEWYYSLDKNFNWMVLAGFLAQLVDGALGMGYGVTSTTILLSTGINPAAISGSIHAAEMFASGASGYSHYKFGNVNKKMFKALLIPGVLGAILGAILLIKLGDTQAKYIKPILALYTMFLGIKILINAFRSKKVQKKFRHYGWLAGVGGFLDSFGGGGWGPIVTTTLITKGRSPRYVIGSVSLTEFFVTLASAFTFFTLIGVSHWQVILALIIGGLVGAPIAAKLAGRLPRKTSMILLGALVIFWSLKILVKIL